MNKNFTGIRLYVITIIHATLACKIKKWNFVQHVMCISMVLNKIFYQGVDINSFFVSSFVLRLKVFPQIMGTLYNYVTSNEVVGLCVDIENAFMIINYTFIIHSN